MVSSWVAIPDLSNILPIKINKGTAISVSLVNIEKILFGITPNNTIGKISKKFPIIANKIAVPASVSATG